MTQIFGVKLPENFGISTSSLSSELSHCYAPLHRRTIKHFLGASLFCVKRQWLVLFGNNIDYLDFSLPMQSYKVGKTVACSLIVLWRAVSIESNSRLGQSMKASKMFELNGLQRQMQRSGVPEACIRWGLWPMNSFWKCLGTSRSNVWCKSRVFEGLCISSRAFSLHLQNLAVLS